MHVHSFGSEEQNATKQRELKNPIYGGDYSPQPQAKTSSKFKLAVKESVLNTDRTGFAIGPSSSSNTNDEAVYDMADIPSGKNYSVVAKAHGMEPNLTEEYNVLVHKRDQFGRPPNNFPQEEYSKLQI